MLNANSIRIAWLLPSAWFYWQPTISELRKQFPETKIFTARWPGYSPGYEDSLDIEVVGERKILEIQPGERGYGSNFTYVSPFIVFPLLNFHPHIIFSNSFGLWTIISLLLKLFTGWKVVIAYEGSSPGVDFRNSKLRLLIRQLMVRFADAVITNSQSGSQYLVDVLNASPQSVLTHPYEVPAAKSLLREQDNNLDAGLTIEGQKPIFLFVGRIIPRKGLQHLIEACVALQNKGYKNYTLLVVGDGEQRAELEAYSQACGLETCIRWMGKVPYDQINAYFQAADIFVLPTLEDTWGVVVLEAMLFGKAVLCSKGAGSSELIAHGENGYVFEPDQPEQLAEHMMDLIDHPELASVMGQNSRKLMEKLTPEAASDFIVDLVHHLQGSL